MLFQKKRVKKDHIARQENIGQSTQLAQPGHFACTTHGAFELLIKKGALAPPQQRLGTLCCTEPGGFQPEVVTRQWLMGNQGHYNDNNGRNYGKIAKQIGYNLHV